MCNGTVGRGLVLGSRLASNARFHKTAKREQLHYAKQKIHCITQTNSRDSFNLCICNRLHYTQIDSPENNFLYVMILVPTVNHDFPSQKHHRTTGFITNPSTKSAEFSGLRTALVIFHAPSFWTDQGWPASCRGVLSCAKEVTLDL